MDVVLSNPAFSSGIPTSARPVARPFAVRFCGFLNMGVVVYLFNYTLELVPLSLGCVVPLSLVVIVPLSLFACL